jgi:hypothetical protein
LAGASTTAAGAQSPPLAGAAGAGATSMTGAGGIASAFFAVVWQPTNGDGQHDSANTVKQIPTDVSRSPPHIPKRSHSL